MSKNEKKQDNVKAIVLIVLSVVLFAYAAIIGFTPVILGSKLQNKQIIPELEKLTQLKIDYKDSKVKMTPLFEIIVTISGITAEKKDVDMKVLNTGKVVLSMGPSVLFGKNYSLNYINVNSAEYFEVLDNGVPEIKTFLEKYSLLAKAGASYTIKTCPITIQNLKINSFNSTSQYYSERTKSDVVIEASEVEDFLNVVSQGVIKTK